MSTFIIGKNTKRLVDEMQCPGMEIYHMDMYEEEFGHMSCLLESEIYWIYLVRGGMVCQLNQVCLELHSGEGVFINRDTMFRFAGGMSGGCEFYLISMKADCLSGKNLPIKYTYEIIECQAFPYMKIGEEHKETILYFLQKMAEEATKKEVCFEYEIAGLCCQIWGALYRCFTNQNKDVSKSRQREADKLRRMLTYLHANYDKKITLTEIAGVLNISSGDYCRFFKKHMGQTPFEYLQEYRIERTIPELLKKETNISEFSLAHGFHGSSYYAETFRKEMGCTPGEYRKWHWAPGDVHCPVKRVQVGSGLPKNVVKKDAAERGRQETMPTHLL